MRRRTTRARRVGAAAAVLVAAGIGGSTLWAHGATGTAAPVTADRSPGIVGGSPAATNAYPWIVALSARGNFFCGGALINRSWVVTAAHCVQHRSAAQLSLLIGQSDRVSGTGGEHRSVTEVVVDPGFVRATYVDDVALLHLDTPSTQKPLRIAAPVERHAWAAGVRVRVLGWGRTSEKGGPVAALRQVDVPVQADAVMSSSAAYGTRFHSDVMLGAGPWAGGKDSCTGDSGGPLAADTRRGWRLVGLVSWGDGCARAHKPGVYARVADDPLNAFIRATAR